jgi:hypothetical protein
VWYTSTALNTDTTPPAPPSVTPLIDEWLAALDVRTVEARRQFLESRATDLLRRMESLREELDGVIEELERARDVLQLKHRLAEPRDQKAATVVTAPAAADAASTGQWFRFKKSKPLRGRQAVMRIMEDNPNVREWSATDLLNEMIRLGWAEGKADYHSVQVAMSRLARDGELVKPGYGRYSLPSNGGSLLDDEGSAPKGPAPSGDDEREEGGTPHSSGVPPSTSEGAPGEDHRAGA